MKSVGRALALARLVSSSSPAKRVNLTHSLTILDPSSSAHYSTTFTLSSLKSPTFRKQKPQQSAGSDSAAQKSDGDCSVSNEWPRPSEIPWQAKVANSVNLIGTVQAPVRFDASSGDGKYYARTVISQGTSPDTPSLRIQITFEGDLAHVAVCHLRENDRIYIAGQLNAIKPLSTLGNRQTDIQVVVGSVNFVEKSSQLKKSSAPLIQGKLAQNSGVSVEKSSQLKESSAPLIQGKLAQNSANSKKYGGPTLSSWRNLMENPKLWSDYRTYKETGMVNPRYPDFTSKDGKALWLDTAPDSVLLALKGLEFDPIIDAKAGDLWRSLVENPDKWWDNRLNKFKTNSPDFKHKDTGEGLWLSSCPLWVKSKLPLLTTNPI